jgi:predicted negative regulator of RcsB-dependent stress response
MLADNNEKLDEALAMIQVAVEADPINGAYLDSLGWVYYRLDRLELAEKFGDLYERTGRPDEARDAYRRSLERAEDPDERDRVQRKLDRL